MIDIDFLKNNPVFFSRLGMCYDPPIKGVDGRPAALYTNPEREAKYHTRFLKAGVVLHTMILHTGWTGIDEYDYSRTDEALNAFFKYNPEGIIIPRIKLNVPIDWCRKNPEELLVYYEGPRKAEEIRKLVGTLRQDWLGYDDENGYYQADGDFSDKRPNINTLISLQSFSSKKWLNDAGAALRRLILHLENSAWGERIAGYHIAYGACGESMMWGRQSFHYGDYGVSNMRNFYDWALDKYHDENALKSAWHDTGLTRENICLPSPGERYGRAHSVKDFLRGRNCDRMNIDYDCFLSDANSAALENFCKIVKDTCGKLCGVFYGYMEYMSNSAYAGHLGIGRVLNSPYIDFVAAPKSYHRCAPGEPGGEMCPTQSVGLKKLWLDELDNRTFLCRNAGNAESRAADISETFTVMWRELCKNLSNDSGFWWMDLGGGWFEDDRIESQIKYMVKCAKEVRKIKHKSLADVLVLIDENSILHTRVSHDSTFGFMQDFMAELQMSGVLFDVYRLSDLDEIDTSRYKMTIFAYTFSVNSSDKACISKKLKHCKLFLYNYAAGAWCDEQFSMQNITDFTGFRTADSRNEEFDFPQLKILPDSGTEVIECDNDGNVVLAAGRDTRIYALNTRPYMQAERLRYFAEKAGCHLYGPGGITYYGDNRIFGVFSAEDAVKCEIKLNCGKAWKDIVSGKTYSADESFELQLLPKSAAILVRQDLRKGVL